MQASRARIAAVVLAAGRSARMGRSKALLPLGGKPLLLHVIDNLLASEAIESLVVVTGHEPAAIEATVSDRPVQCVHNRDYDFGMFSSIHAGLDVVASDADAAFVVLVDHPLVSPATLRGMASAYRSRRPRVIVPKHRDKRGHPVLLCGRGFEEILSLPRDDRAGGATLKTYTSRYPDSMLELAVDDPAVIQDLDTPADYAAAVEALERAGREPLDQRSEVCPNHSAVSAEVPLEA